MDKPEQYYSQAREQAMNDAKAKAQELAKLSGVTLGQVTFVSESISGSYPYYPTMEMRASYGLAVPAAAPSISPGQSDVVLSVQVAYAVQ